MKLWKSFFVIALAIMLIIPLGCSSSANSSGNSSSGKVKLTFWRIDYSPENKAFQELIKNFEQKNPNITIDFKTFPTSEYETKIRTALASHNAPDIMAIDAPMIASYASQQAIIPLDKYMNEKDYQKDDIFKPVLKGMTYDGSLYAAPSNDASLAMYYNIKMFKEKGIPLPSQDPNQAWTWDQVLEAAKKLNDPSHGVYGLSLTMGGFTQDEGATFSEEPYFWQAGGEILNPKATTAKGYLDSTASKDALKFFKTVYNDTQVGPKEFPTDGFPNGKLAILVQGPWQLSTWKQDYPNFKLGTDFGVAPLWKGKKQVTPNGSWNLGITSQSKNADAAWKFVSYATGVEGSKIWYKDTSNLPARQSTIDAFKELGEYPLNIFVEQSKNNAHPRPATPAYPEVSDTLRNLIESVVMKNQNIDDAVNNAVDTIDNALKNPK